MERTAGEDHTSPRRIRPLKRACVDCHARKVKCDGASNGFPCSNCRTAGVECTVAQRRKRRRVSSNESSTRNRVVPRTVATECHSNLPVDLDESQDSEAACPVVSEPLPQIPETATATPDHAEGVDSSHRDAESKGAGGYSKEYELAKQHLVEFFNQDLQDNPIRARSTYVGNELSNLNYLTRQRAANQHVYHYPCSNVYVPREFRNTQTLATPNLIPKDAFVLPPKHVSDILVADYFSYVHPQFPIIDRDKFLAFYHAPDQAPSILLMQAICLVGSHVTKAYKNNQDQKVAFFRRAKALIDGRYEEDRMNVVQAALLLTWFSDGSDDICANAWWWIGVAARTAVGLGMHREVGPSKMPTSDKRIWRMIWWCLVQADCLVSLCYGRPQNINLDDCDVPPLRPEDFDSTVTEKEANAVIHHAMLCAIISDLVRTHFSVRALRSHASGTYPLEAVDKALAEWLAGLPPDLRDCPRKHLASADQVWQLQPHLTYYAVLIQFHRPFINFRRPISESESIADKEICIEAASKIIQIFDQLSQSSALRYCWFWTPSALFTAMLQVTGQLKSNNPILALGFKEKYESGLHSLRKLTRYWLFATSVLRLFESNSIRSSDNLNSQRQEYSPLEQISPDQESPLLTVTSVGAWSSNAGPRIPTNEDGANQPQAMDWVQLLSHGERDIHSGNMNVERNRWQNSMEEWQSLYWSDPLAHIRLEDNFGQFQSDWPSH